MMRIPLILLLSLCITSCSVLKRSAESHQSSPQESSTAKVITKPQFVTPPTSTTPNTHPTPTAPALVEEMELSSDFSRLELEHVKFSDHDPFPAGSNTFSLSLKEQQSKFTFPLNTSRLSSVYGMRGRSFHSGVDLLEDSGAPVYAAFDGIVRISKPYSGYGNMVVLRHHNGLETVYAHNSKNMVKAGDMVRSGEQIATVGRTGRASANHLHFEVRILGHTIDPRLLVDLDNKTLQTGTLQVEKRESEIVAHNRSSGIIQEVRTPQPPPEKIIPATPPKAPATAQYHTIVKGNTLYAIARRYGTTVSAICRLNGITEKTILSLGRKLRVK